MDVANINGSVVSQSAYQQARASVANMQGGNQSIGNILSTIRQLVPGLNVSTITEPFSGSGANLGIHPEILRRAADDPEEMVRVKALAMDAYIGETAFRQGMEARGITVHAHGTIIHEDGTTSGWAIVQGPDLRERRTQFELPYDYDEDDRPSWAELMHQQLEEAMREAEENQPNHLEDEEATRSWMA